MDFIRFLGKILKLFAKEIHIGALCGCAKLHVLLMSSADGHLYKSCIFLPQIQGANKGSDP